MSFGRALRKMPSRASESLVPRRAGRRRRASTTISATTVSDDPDDDRRRARGCDEPRTIVIRATIAPGRTHRTGSSQARRGRAIIRRPRNSICAAGRVVDAGDDVEERRLAGAVRPDQADDRALRDREVDAVDRDQAAEALGHAAGRGGCRSSLQGVARRRSSPGSVLGAGDSPAPSAPPRRQLDSSATCSSRRRRWLGNRPSGRNSIISTRAMPYSRNWYSMKSMSRGRDGSGQVERRSADSRERVELLEEHRLDHVDDERADGDAPDVAHAAEDDHRQDGERHREQELVRARRWSASRR